MKKYDLTCLVPPGVNAKEEAQAVVLGLAASVIFSFGFLIRLNKVCREEAAGAAESIPVFPKLLGNSLAGFVVMIIAMALLCIVHWHMHYKDSKSIYLLKRLPDKLELLRRTAGLPIAGAALSIILALILFAVYFAVFNLYTW